MHVPVLQSLPYVHIFLWHICKMMITKGHVHWNNYRKSILSSEIHKIEWLLPVPSGQTWKWMPQILVLSPEIFSLVSHLLSLLKQLQKAGHSFWDQRSPLLCHLSHICFGYSPILSCNFSSHSFSRNWTIWHFNLCWMT